MIAPDTKSHILGSFRDPSGFLFSRDGLFYRQINLAYREDYDYFLSSGLYDALVENRLLIPHAETDILPKNTDKAYKIIKPEPVPFISYPYEWCFSQLKHAALAMLKIQKKALGFGMTLKDSSAYNIQFLDCKPLLIDTLSFERYREGQYWAAYRQFCQHFLAPLALMSHVDVRLNQLSRIYIDGIPLDLASAMLPFRKYFKFSLFSHIYCHHKFQKYYENKSINPHVHKLSRLAFLALIDNLESIIEKLRWQPGHTIWNRYYEDINYSPEAVDSKKEIITELIRQTKPRLVFDIAANNGFFSRIASSNDIQTISFDNDYSVVEENYLSCVKNKEANILPLVIDITNPSPGIGWGNEERMSFFERGPADAILALALIHHLVICHNIPLEEIALFFHKNCKFIMIEFVPISDSNAQRLLAGRKNIFQDYTRENFERIFSRYFTMENSVKLRDSERILYLLKRR